MEKFVYLCRICHIEYFAITFMINCHGWWFNLFNWINIEKKTFLSFSSSWLLSFFQYIFKIIDDFVQIFLVQKVCLQF